MFKSWSILIFGDLLTLAILTLIGFANHGETDISFLPRFLATYVPLSSAWLLISTVFRLFHPEILLNRRQLWRVPAAMLMAAPLAGVLRGWLLNEPVQPVFVLVLSFTSALGLSIWRSLYVWLGLDKSRS